MIGGNHNHLTSVGYEGDIFCLCYFLEGALYFDGKFIFGMEAMDLPQKIHCMKRKKDTLYET